LEEGAAGDLRRALETALAVCYCRPFRGNKIGVLGENWLPTDPSERQTHDNLRILRDKVFAHSDESLVRGIEDLGELYGPDHVARYVEAWVPLKESFVLKVRALAAKQETLFKTAAHEIEEKLRDAFELASDDSEGGFE
jgi:hypothetical protein